MSLLEVDGLSVTFPSEDGEVHAVRGVSFTVEPGEVLGVVGESGSGKSVSLMAVPRLLPGSAKVTGSVRFDGTELVGAPAETLRKLRGSEIAMIFQDPMSSMNPVHTVGRQIAEARRAHASVSKDEAWRDAVAALALVDIPQPETRAKQYPHEFSGGMRQRAMIAMAMVNKPRLIIADEPTTALDVTVQAQVLEVLDQARVESGASLVLVSHDLGVVAGTADRVQVMYGGTIVETGPTEEVFDRPRMPYTVGLLSSLPALDQIGGRLHPIPGAPPSLVSLPPGCSFAPRCPLVEDACLAAEPDLVSVGPDHLSRCRRWEVLAEGPTENLFSRTEVPA
ncbi:ABC transporter ATP-binding protein [Actinomycetospora corticicola]|uniref:Oligopeptide/dipeptide ABC transporter ATP-binding protein n=1 Tax=Actinomycetospora corticicola TaxID=663602 RepID=A0A7Y9E1Q2_9PSEU|nr:ABC transporter ATP-binding protein [Actinomycetospora corticicola]NYD39376.1 oligopeptide/dipeptide ABC transporter ATP-binding protein [Actinomycetospora corticicola]